VFGPSESESSEVGLGPIYSGMIWSALLGDADADGDSVRAQVLADGRVAIAACMFRLRLIISR
jgi:hypothetical protein